MPLAGDDQITAVLKDRSHFKPREELSEIDRLEIPMCDYQILLYKGGLQKLREAALEGNQKQRATLSFGALHLMKAVCAEPYCLPGSKFKPDANGVEAHLQNSPKLKWVMDHLQNIRSKGEKAIIFTELREAQLSLYFFLREMFSIKPFIINGDSEKRQEYIDKFSASEGFDVIILSTLAAGAGLNVTAANHVFHFTRAWNPAKENQATDRAYRIGQERDVYVYCPTMVSDFPTFELRLDELMRRKASLADSTLDNDVVSAMLNGTGGDIGLKDLFENTSSIADLDGNGRIGFHKLKCPECLAPEGVGIFYGFPTDPEVLELADQGRLVIGGCVLGEATHQCLSCGHKWSQTGEQRPTL